MGPHDLLVARERAYTLLGDLLRVGLRPELAPAVQAIESLAQALPQGWDADALAASHHRLFSLEAPPYEGFFLAADRLLGGPTSEAVARAYAAGGFRPQVADTAPDHLGVELGFLGWLAGARADAVRDGQDAADDGIATLERDFLDQHLLRWLPVLVAACPEPDGFYGRVLTLALELARSHRAGLDGVAAAWTLPPLPDLDDPKTGLRQLSEALCTPCHAGGLLTRSDIAMLGRREKLPRGFGDRTQTLANLLRSAARFEVLDAVFEGLDGHLEGWAHALGDDPLLAPWQDRIAGSRARLEHMRRQAADLSMG